MKNCRDAGDTGRLTVSVENLRQSWIRVFRKDCPSRKDHAAVFGHEWEQSFARLLKCLPALVLKVNELFLYCMGRHLE